MGRSAPIIVSTSYSFPNAIMDSPGGRLPTYPAGSEIPFFGVADHPADDGLVTEVQLLIHNSTGQTWDGAAFTDPETTVGVDILSEPGRNVEWTYRFPSPENPDNYITTVVAVDQTGAKDQGLEWTRFVTTDDDAAD